MKLYKACGMPYCAAITKGLFCTRHANMTPEEEAAELGELRRRVHRHDELFHRVRRLREEGRPDDEVDAAMEEAEEARLHLNELFGEPIEDPTEDPG